jgi:hydrogenase nickel incorporation protein HypA/HybF
MQSILALAEQTARAEGASCIHKVRLRIGRLSGVVPEALEGAFEVLREGTLASRGQLVIEETPAAGWCAPCKQEFETPELIWECPRCGTPSSEIRRGRELELASLEIS